MQLPASGVLCVHNLDSTPSSSVAGIMSSIAEIQHSMRANSSLIEERVGKEQRLRQEIRERAQGTKCLAIDLLDFFALDKGGEGTLEDNMKKVLFELVRVRDANRNTVTNMDELLGKANV